MIIGYHLQNLIYLLTPDLNSNCPFPSSLKIDDNKLLEWETLIEVNDNVKIGLNWQGSSLNPRVANNSVSLNNFKSIVKKSISYIHKPSKRFSCIRN